MQANASLKVRLVKRDDSQDKICQISDVRNHQPISYHVAVVTVCNLLGDTRAESLDLSTSHLGTDLGLNVHLLGSYSPMQHTVSPGKRKPYETKQ